MQIINFSGGLSNATEFCTELMDLPKLDTWLETLEDFVLIFLHFLQSIYYIQYVGQQLHRISYEP